MKNRLDFVTNSSSSSFIISNNTDELMTSEDVARKIFEKIIEDAKDRFELAPGESITYECGDHTDDGAFEMFIHNVYDEYHFQCNDVSIEYHESHH
jgi:hypothetical protein